MLVIRLQRTGRKNDPAYRIVLAEKRHAAKGKFLEVLGHYLPARNPAVLEFQKDRVEHWIGRGACPSDTIARLFKAQGIAGMEKFIERYAKQRPKKAPPEEPAAPAPAPAAAAPAEEKKEEAAPVEEKPVEEPKAEEPAKQEEAPAEEKKEESAPAEEKPAEEPAKEEAPAEEKKEEAAPAEEESDNEKK